LLGLGQRAKPSRAAAAADDLGAVVPVVALRLDIWAEKKSALVQEAGLRIS